MKKDERELYFAQNMPLPETPKPAANVKPWHMTAVVGKALPRVDAYERVSGKAVYPSDITFPDMLYAAVLRSPYAHAVVKGVDTGEAEKMTGVRAVISGKTPGMDVLWPYTPDMKTKLFDPSCRFEGEAIAAVAAETPYQAWDAVRAVKVNYDILPFVSDERKSLEAGAAQVHTEGNRVKTEKYERGDIAKGFAEADVILEQTFRMKVNFTLPWNCTGAWQSGTAILLRSGNPRRECTQSRLGLPRC
jgi:xanthine dehydrogenase YagR molybdenum-binding subunit